MIKRKVLLALLVAVILYSQNEKLIPDHWVSDPIQLKKIDFAWGYYYGGSGIKYTPVVDPVIFEVSGSGVTLQGI